MKPSIWKRACNHWWPVITRNWKFWCWMIARKTAGRLKSSVVSPTTACALSPDSRRQNDWLAKNYAYQQLAEAANGELLLFCGVDTRFEPGSLRALVALHLTTKASMISVLPAKLAAAEAGPGTLASASQPLCGSWPCPASGLNGRRCSARVGGNPPAVAGAERRFPGP